jgi:hypothetical protein
MLEETNEAPSMSQLREAVAKSREAFLRELTKPGSVVIYLIIGAVVSLVNVIEAYKAHRPSDAVVAVVIWLVFLPLIARWTNSKWRR